MKSIGDILDDFPQQDNVDVDCPMYASIIMKRIKGIELASDFIVCDEVMFREYNILISSESQEIKNQWTVFATSGQGDFWLLQRDKNNIGFYDHDKENINLSTIQSLDFDLEKWVILANLVYQLENLEDVSEYDENDFRVAILSLELDIEKLPFSFL